MIKRNKWKILVSFAIILIPMLVGLILWNRLPERIPTHWGPSGTVDGWSGKGMAVFGLPGLLLILQAVCLGATALDPKNKDQTDKVFNIVIFIVPGVSVVAMALVYAVALGLEIHVVNWVMAAVSALVIALGNYLPKCKPNYTIGIKVPWTLESAENWVATHRLAGKIWVAGGFVMLAASFAPGEAPILIIIVSAALMGFIPVLYSYLYYKKHRSK